jgi:hypothetical protein
MVSHHPAAVAMWSGCVWGTESIPCTGLYHIGAREYDPAPPAGCSATREALLQGIRIVYLYCGNDPLNAADPYGLDWDWAKYFGQVGNVCEGYGQALLGRD